jgi:excinuclease UvrABC nuclease subunit
VPTHKNGKKPPELPGEYRIRSPKGQLLYIGETNNLARRIREHIRSGKIPMNTRNKYYVEYMVASKSSSSRSRREHEKQKIKQHRPKLNKSNGGEGRIALPGNYGGR